jgi:hypothetical protein
MHITQFLEQAAPPPTRALDVAALAARAQRPRWLARRWAWLVGLLAVGGLAVPIGANLLPASSPSTRLVIEHARPGVSVTTTTVLGAPPVLTPGSRLVPRPGHGQVPPRSATTAPSGNETDSCVVDGSEVGVDPAGMGGAGIGDFPGCDYDASSDAGYTANGAWEMSVTRPDGSVDHYGPGYVSGPDRTGHACGPVGTVHAGDHVHVILYAGAENSAHTYYVRVGPKYHC